MNRHWLGVVVVLLTLIVAVVVPNVDGRAVAGQGQAVPVDSPPQVGDCLLDQVPGHEVAYDRNGQPRYVTGLIAPCTGNRFGEVAGILPDGLTNELTSPLSPGPDASGPQKSLVDSNMDQCSISFARYLSLPLDATTMQLPLQFTYWTPMVTAGFSFYTPTARQQAAGQSWVACVAHPSVFDSGVQPSYNRSVRDDGPVPGPFAACATTYSQPDGWIPAPCDGPHRVEILGLTVSIGPDYLDSATQQDLDTTCQSLAAQRTGISDLPGVMNLQVSAPASHTTDSTGIAQEGLGNTDSHRNAACIITATGSTELTGSLVGLDDRPIPWI